MSTARRLDISCNAKLGDFARIMLQLAGDLVGGAPAQLDRLDTLRVVAGVPDVHLLCDPAALLRGELATGLGLELEFVALGRDGVSF